MGNLLKQDQDRLRLFKRYGYDIPRAREFILTKAKVSEGTEMCPINTMKDMYEIIKENDKVVTF
ncbi:MAG: hypothetical protein COT38_06020 [Candidatus Omnitrophica bacterium CG08_land_8_20_14_0_20_41_16]|uniref:Uncharacterized protein n=1 Tax=Candidatus Sherwoodlollariibacterium unditelluris TaxID=1974757 RepID=A0A2G9YJX3_9BACT|nr:MAG: hypothetical protein COX41_02330 [Candidatus Omnitrophica bacterium CG23_combo_of_CG06-09_8_20_14_all_41_10]PIS33303.1 MAG: hypothetical protein COT38_06020 [Candidatus Omnitrophica bacterium CG08_land_8_20_14_0_20_41_16]